MHLGKFTKNLESTLQNTLQQLAKILVTMTRVAIAFLHCTHLNKRRRQAGS